MNNKLHLKIKAALELGADQVFYNVVYKAGLKTGYYRRASKRSSIPDKNYGGIVSIFNPLASELIRSIIGPQGVDQILNPANEAMQGRFLQFGDTPTKIRLDAADAQFHWTEIEQGKGRSKEVEDIKLVWEPARFCWGIKLAQAYYLTDDERYCVAYLHFLNEFIKSNPENFGSNWVSAQEVAIRLLNVVIAHHYFSRSTVWQLHLDTMTLFVQQHADRILLTLAYARSQNNNHYLSECVGLITAALFLPKHPHSHSWYHNGWEGFNWCIRNQIDESGEYVQHSTNYHRLMLQLSLWVYQVDQKMFKPDVLQQLSKASIWIANQTDEISGRVPNFGANDGALIFPFSSSDHTDFRPITQSSISEFTKNRMVNGPWDDELAWFGKLVPLSSEIFKRGCSGLLQIGDLWGSLRTINFHNRPSHADHLHAEVWCKGVNIAIDPGTYSYNLPAPWDNPFTSAMVHNTITIDNIDQMDRVSKFLFANWGSSTIIEQSKSSIRATSSAYQRMGIQQTRTISVTSSKKMMFTDQLVSRTGNNIHIFKCHWLLADLGWVWQFDRGTLTLRSDSKTHTQLTISTKQQVLGFQIVKRGELMDGISPTAVTDGWTSPTYNTKVGALSVSYLVQADKNCQIDSLFEFEVI